MQGLPSVTNPYILNPSIFLTIVTDATASIRDQSLFINSSNLFLNIVTDGKASIRDQSLYY
jgi:hypothetical protein